MTRVGTTHRLQQGSIYPWVACTTPGAHPWNKARISYGVRLPSGLVTCSTGNKNTGVFSMSKRKQVSVQCAKPCSVSGPLTTALVGRRRMLLEGVSHNLSCYVRTLLTSSNAMTTKFKQRCTRTARTTRTIPCAPQGSASPRNRRETLEGVSQVLLQSILMRACYWPNLQTGVPTINLSIRPHASRAILRDERLRETTLEEAALITRQGE